MTDRSKEGIDAAKYLPASDSKRINRAVEKSNSDPDFVDYAVGRPRRSLTMS
ncbi:MAG TPA: hypothetical protein VJZ68_07165 [Nitrososphaera sp.]|nr:hypothetical protein [Nitrososphaera sp.]